MESFRLVTAGNDIKFWDCSNGFSLLHAFNPHGNRTIASLSWNVEGSLLASCAQEDEQIVLTYTKTAASQELRCGAGIQCTDFSQSSRLLVCGGADGVSVWDLKTKGLKKSFKEHKGPVTSAKFNFNNSYIASGSETGEIILHNINTGQSSSPIVAPGILAIRQLEYSTFKKSMFGTASDDGAITLWDANTRRALHQFKDAHAGPATGLAFSPLNERLMMSVGLDYRFVCYDIQKKSILKVTETQSPLTCIDVMPDGATVAVGSTRGKVYIYDLRQGGSAPTYTFQAHKTSVRSIKFMPSAKSKSGDTSGVKASMAASSGGRRQLPPAPLVMQDITPSKTGQTPDTDLKPHAVSTDQNLVFSPTLQGNLSQTQDSKLESSNLNITRSRGDSSFAGVFSPLTKGGTDLSAMSAQGDISSLLSVPSFLQQNNSGMQSPPAADRIPYSNINAVGESTQPSSQLPSTPVSTGQVLEQPGLPASSVGHLSHMHHSGAGQSPVVGHSPHFHHMHHSGMGQSPVAGHESLLHNFGIGQSPLTGQPYPQLSSSLQSMSLDAASSTKGGGSRQPEAHAPPGQMSRQVPMVQEMSSYHAANGASCGTSGGRQNRSGQSASPDSAAISGGEEGGSDGGGGISSRRDLNMQHAVGTNGTASSSSAPADGPINFDAVGSTGATQREFLRSLVTDAMEDVRDDLHRDIQGLHVAMLRQFFDFEKEVKSTLSHYAEMNQKLLLYTRQLEEENKRLKKNY